MKLSRRSFMKANAVAAAAAAAGLSVPGVARAVVGQQEAIKWDKAPCRFCGTGCGVLVEMCIRDRCRPAVAGSDSKTNR